MSTPRSFVDRSKVTAALASTGSASNRRRKRAEEEQETDTVFNEESTVTMPVVKRGRGRQPKKRQQQQVSLNKSGINTMMAVVSQIKHTNTLPVRQAPLRRGPFSSFETFRISSVIFSRILLEYIVLEQSLLPKQ